MSFFTKDDCSIHIGGSVGEHYIELGIANAKLEATGADPLTTHFREECERLRAELAALKVEIESAPVVYGPARYCGTPSIWTDEIDEDDSHRARLIRIEVLK